MHKLSVVVGLAFAMVAMPLLAQAQQDSNSLIGVFTEAPENQKIVGSQLTITGLATPEATMVWPDGYDTKLRKIFENTTLLVLQSVSAAGSTDTVYVETKNKRFLVVSVGAMAIVVKGRSTTVSQYRGYIK